MGILLSKGKRSSNSPKETEKRPGDIDCKGRTPRVPKDSDQEFSVYTDPPITGNNISFSSSESTNGSVQTTRRVTEHAIIEYIDIGGIDITQIDQLDSGSVSHDKSDTASCLNVQTTIDTCSTKRNETTTGSSQNHGIRTEDKIFGNKDYTHFNLNTNSAGYSKRNSENYEQTGSITTIDGTKTNKKKKKKKGILTSLMKSENDEQTIPKRRKKKKKRFGISVMPKPFEPKKADYRITQEENTGGKIKMSVSEQQVKTMTMEAERLAERCRFDIETSNANDELKLCPKAFIQSINSVEKYISHSISENNKLTMEKNEYLNRPMKLADRFNKIYDDEWTDMIEMLEKKGPNTEEHKEKCVYHLYSILIVIFNSLSKKAEVQLKGLGKHLFLLTKPSTEQINATWYDYKEERVQLIASRKKTAVTTILMLYQTLQTDPIFLQELCECSPPLDDVMLSDILPSEYFMKCVEICWYFVIQDPPMYVETVSLKGIKIDKDTHKVYTKSGDIVKYHVWPALYLHHQDGTNSPLMGKGVVQPE